MSVQVPPGWLKVRKKSGTWKATEAFANVTGDGEVRVMRDTGKRSWVFKKEYIGLLPGLLFNAYFYMLSSETDSLKYIWKISRNAKYL